MLFLPRDTLVVYGAIIAGVLVHENTFRGETQVGKSVRRLSSIRSRGIKVSLARSRGSGFD